MPNPAADRNLLFGILALQMDFISRDALITAMNAWVLDKVKPLGQILQEQGALSADNRAWLEAGVEKHLAAHGNDPQKSLAALSSLGPAREHLQQVADADVQASLARMASQKEQDDPVATRPPAVGESTSDGLRFRILRPHAEGGLGRVSVALDRELHREVALKEIKDLHADDPESRTRFVLEAEITGGLEHPGIVPVYGLGSYADGRPFYAMRFVRGDSLKDAIERFHAADTPGRDPGERALEFRKLLGRFVDVCNAVAYAHSRGVLHRDLKPGNVMLGPYGETLVVDWGLAKAVGKAETHATSDEPTLRPRASSGSAETLPGSAIGTPAYMSPKQAAGEIDKLGPASDVYSLGATLYCLLAGRAPFEKEDVWEVLQRVQRGDYPRPRAVKPGVPAALEAICLKAMAVRPEDRYPNPRELAEDVEHWLADEPVAAYREPLAVRARRWARKHKPLVAGVSALLLTALLLGGGFGLWWKQQHDALVGAVQDHLDRAEQLRDLEQWDQARQALDRAQARLAGAGPAWLHERLQQLREQMDVVRQFDNARMQQLVVVDNKLDDAGADRAYQEVFAGLGLDPLGLDAVSVAERIARTPIRKQLTAALDHWAFVKYQLRSSDEVRLLAVVRLADEDPWRQQLRDSSVRKDSAKLRRLAEEKEVLMQPPANLVLLSLFLKRVQLAGTAERLLRQAQAHHPTDFSINFMLGIHLAGEKSSNKEEAIGYYRAALALQPQSVAVYNNLGLLLKDQQKLAEAEAAYRRAIAIQPNLAQAWYNLGNLLAGQQKPAEAEAAYRKAVQLQPDHAPAWYSLGLLLAEQQKPSEVEAAYRKAIEIQPDHAPAWTNLGLRLAEQQKPAEAEAAYRKAVQLQPDYAPAWNNLGNLLKDQQKPAEAEAAYRKAIEIQPDYAKAWNNLGLLLAGQQKPAGAAFRKAIEAQPDYAMAWYNLGVWLAEQQKPAEAEAAYRKAVQLQPDYAPAWNNLGSLLKDQQKPAEAEAPYRKAVQLQPNYAPAWINLGLLLVEQQKPAEAEAAYRKAFAIAPKMPQAHAALGQILLAQGRLNEARDATQRALELLPHRHPLHKFVT